MRRWQVTIRRYANYPAGDDVRVVVDTWAEARDLIVADLRRFEHDPGGLRFVIPHFLAQLAALEEGEGHYFTTACGEYTLGDETREDGTYVFPAGEERVVIGERGWDGRPAPPYVWVDPDCWARGPWQALAATLAEPLRKAFAAHLDEHGCAERTGFAYCDEAMRLFRLLPAGDRTVVAIG